MAALDHKALTHTVVSPASLCFMATAVEAKAVTSCSNQPQAQLPAGSGHRIPLGISTGNLLSPCLLNEAKTSNTKRAASSNLPQDILLAAKASSKRWKSGSYSWPPSGQLCLLCQRNFRNPGRATPSCLKCLQSCLGPAYSKLSLQKAASAVLLLTCRF